MRVYVSLNQIIKMCYNFDKKVVIVTGGLSVGLTATKLVHSLVTCKKATIIHYKNLNQKELLIKMFTTFKWILNLKILVDSAILRFGDLHYVLQTQVSAEILLLMN